MINTYNETDLHRTLKNMYALEYNGKTEVAVEKWICDIVTEGGDVIEIQTSNISKLTEKTRSLLAAGKKITIVHPLITEKTIETYAADGTLVSRRKSPKSQTIYAILKNLTGIYPLLLENNFTLEVLYVSLTEQRRKTDSPTQLANKSRRFLKDWVPQGKKLNEVLKKERFKTKTDYLRLIPAPLIEQSADAFTVSSLQKAILAAPTLQAMSKSNRTAAAAQARLLVWIFTRMGLLEESGKKGRSMTFRICR